GVNLRAFARALLSNFSSDAPRQGASTISQQVVKNEFLAGLPRDGRYKGLQAHYATMLEKKMTKNEILERYLNTVFFGNNAYGIAAAAEIYFGKQVAELGFVEAAFLAGLVRSPSGYDPINNPERSRARFAQVLDRLVDDGLLTELEVTEIEETFAIPERVRSIPTRATKRTYYTEALREYLLNESNLLGETYEERYNKLFRGGLRIHTTLNPYLQLKAEEARDVLPDTVQGIDAAIVSLDTKTGAIRAMVGGRGFEPGRNEVNMALAPSQTGSSIKIFILAAALQAGAEPDDIIDGRKGCRLPSDNPAEPIFEITGGIDGGIFALREHTYRSVNCAFARLSQIVGLYRVVDMTYRMASSTYLYRGQPAEEREPILPHASFATGANEMSTLDMAAGMQTIANLGVHRTPYYVDYIDDASGNRVYTNTSRGERVLDTRVALTEISMLKDVLTVGTARHVLRDFATLRPAAGKTGTQEKNWTAVFVGATPFLSTAVLVRDPARYTSMDAIPEFLADGVDNVQGATYPARIWGAFMEPAHVFEPVTDWPKPPALTRPPVRLYLPGVECLYRRVATATTLPTDEPADSPTPDGADAPDSPDTPGGGVTEQAPPTTVPPVSAPPTGTTIPADPPATTVPPAPVLTAIDSGTTIPPDELDPRAPLPSVPLSVYVAPCR
ncbi:MAG TPA: transglycosylase domain-containing protein, partial [Ilumatobacteraceae bacterium]|nr:transglycosylase domain-containing protein [Ilumatobacteraceae bacterium]